jgi:hypothetical protein
MCRLPRRECNLHGRAHYKLKNFVEFKDENPRFSIYFVAMPQVVDQLTVQQIGRMITEWGV